jgi:hypothetical protein
MSRQEDIDLYRAANNTLLKCDWVISPYYTVKIIEQLKQIGEECSEPTSKREKEEVGRKIGDLLMKVNLNFSFRAVIVSEGYRAAPTIGKLSHLIESGLFEFYRLNFIAASSIWVPVVEGLLRRLPQVQFRCRNDIHKLEHLTAVHDEDQPLLDAVTFTLSPLLFEKYFESFNSDDDSVTDSLAAFNFNRNLASHLSIDAPTYCRINCLKLLNIFDSLLAIDFMLHGHYKGMFDGKDEFISLREKYYEHLTSTAFTVGEETRLKLLNSHSEFHRHFYMGN